MRRRTPELPLYDNEVWYALLSTYEKYPHAFLSGCTARTMAQYVGHVVEGRYTAARVRRTLLAAVECGAAYEGRQRFLPGRIRTFEIASRRPLVCDAPVTTQTTIYLRTRSGREVERTIIHRSGQLRGIDYVRPGETWTRVTSWPVSHRALY